MKIFGLGVGWLKKMGVGCKAFWGWDDKYFAVGGKLFPACGGKKFWGWDGKTFWGDIAKNWGGMAKKIELCANFFGVG